MISHAADAIYDPEKKLTEFFLAGAKPRSATQRLGMEFEFMCVHDSTGRRIAYDDGSQQSVRAILESMLDKLQGDALTDGQYLVGVKSDMGTISLEPGGQIEWSSPPELSLSELSFRLNDWLRVFNDQLHRRQLRTIEHAFDSHTNNDQIPWVPKIRFEKMRSTYQNKSDIAYAAMGRTAGIHVAVDYADEEDWQKKFRAALLLTPIAIALFANSPDNNTFGHFHSWRPMLWDNFDTVRSRFPKNALHADFSLTDWAHWIIGVPHLFDESFVQRAKQHGLPQRMHTLAGHISLEMQTHLSTIFTPVRTNHYLEIRSIDMQADEYLMVVPTFWAGILGSADSLERVLEMLAPIQTWEAWSRMFYRACHQGFNDHALQRLAEAVVQLACRGLDEHHEENRSFELQLQQFLANKLSHAEKQSSYHENLTANE